MKDLLWAALTHQRTAEMRREAAMRSQPTKVNIAFRKGAKCLVLQIHSDLDGLQAIGFGIFT
ncbi:MAG: hypothetical protein E5V59_16185 [Mesorhizobium sp.]|nr:MAG: hypothetical protein E5V59_16185 [Mesorhizobium sp.]